ncbi:hypothetical protein [Sphingomonas jaspsi]|uniref:hypothetical protein n=1 Tax=Sphingomonas jaspsi TaxID=392409 RepID=UPI0004B94D90|nr:hypothetical protein [Sphingomonas jaspsi]
MANTTLQFYRDRAADARRDGEAATLEHVRERCRRSEEAWTVLGDRLAATEAKRLARESEKAAQPQEE